MFIAPSFLNKNDFEFMDALIDMFKVTRTRAVEDDLNKYDSICLFDLFIDLRKDGMICSYYEDVYRKCHIEICRILNKIGYVNANSQQSKGKSHEIPQLIKVMIYYMSYRYIELYETLSDAQKKLEGKPAQKKILDFLEEKLTDAQGNVISSGFKFTNKTFTNLGISPNVYYDINNYYQIQLPTHYAGAKTDYLGYALNYLVAFAGSIDNFVDLFGGSGSASVAVTQHPAFTDYYINELDFFCVNYYLVISDEQLYAMYKNELKKIQDNLRKNLSVTDGKKFFQIVRKNEMHGIRSIRYKMDTLYKILHINFRLIVYYG